ncbi:MAG: hypothetical protein EXS27_11765 [Pedosphaera sp.]|nr:hypothetical protein [Pedosphaera sp.]
MGEITFTRWSHISPSGEKKTIGPVCPAVETRADVLLKLLTILVNRAHKLCRSEKESTFFLDTFVPDAWLQPRYG